MLEKPSLPRALGGVGSEGFLLFGRLLIANFRWDKLSRLIFFRIWMPLLPKYLAAFTLASTLPSAKSPSGCQGLDVNFYHPLMGFSTVYLAYAGHPVLRDWLLGHKAPLPLAAPGAWLSAQSWGQWIGRRGVCSGLKRIGRGVCRVSRPVSWHHSVGHGTPPGRVAGRHGSRHGTRRGSVCAVRLGCSSTVSPGGFAQPKCAKVVREKCAKCAA